MKNNKRKGIPATAFMASFSSAGRLATEQRVEQPAKFTVVERWDGQKWVETRLQWDGTEYKEIR